MDESLEYIEKMDECIRCGEKLEALRFQNDNLNETLSEVIETNCKLAKEVTRLRSALGFYSSREVYECLNQFPGDMEMTKCSDVAVQALSIESPKNMFKDGLLVLTEND